MHWYPIKIWPSFFGFRYTFFYIVFLSFKSYIFSFSVTTKLVFICLNLQLSMFCKIYLSSKEFVCNRNDTFDIVFQNLINLFQMKHSLEIFLDLLTQMKCFWVIPNSETIAIFNTFSILFFILHVVFVCHITI